MNKKLAGYCITRVEAILAEQFNKCYSAAVGFCIATGWLDKNDYMNHYFDGPQWPFEEQRQANAILSQLRTTYQFVARNTSGTVFASPEAVCIAAIWLK
jgi:hypothetical protein